jgi:Flp pilus assembly pilin Flp
MKHRHWIIDLLTGERGATTVEYAVVLALILLACIGSIMIFGNQTGRMWTGVGSDLKSAGLGQ